MKSSEDGWCWWWHNNENVLTITELCTCWTTVTMVNFMLCLFYHNFLKKAVLLYTALVHIPELFFFLNFIYLFIHLFISWLCWVFVSVGGLPLVAASGGHSSSRCAGLSPSRPLLLRSTGSRRSGSVVVAHGPSCSGACGILPEPGLEPVSPALAGRFSTTAPPGKPLPELFWCDHFNSFWS